MSNINVNILTGSTINDKSDSLWSRYMDYADRKSKEQLTFFISVIIYIPCVWMVFSIYAMSIMTPNYIWFVGLSMILFFTNVILHIAESEGKLFVPLFHATLLILTAIPILTFLITSI